MKTQKLLLSLLILLTTFFPVMTATAGDFDWMRNLAIKAEADPYGFRTRLSTRFRIADTQMSIVLDTVDNLADAYMIFRLGEMSSQPVSYVLDRYKAGGHKGWGRLAKGLGIKPGSKEFAQLKKGYDISWDDDNSKSHKKNKHKGKGKGKG